MSEPRGKDLRWNPIHVARDMRLAWAAFRNSKGMAELADYEHMENQGDQVKLLIERMDADFHSLVELLTEGAKVQAIARAKEHQVQPKQIEAAKS